jgi:hypothetical protein
MLKTGYVTTACDPEGWRHCRRRHERIVTSRFSDYMVDKPKPTNALSNSSPDDRTRYFEDLGSMQYLKCL